MRGDGRLRKFPGSPFWHAVYYVDGREVTESTGKADEQRAERVLRNKVAAARRGEANPHEDKVTLGDLCGIVRTDYDVNRRRSRKTLDYSLAHLLDYFAATAKAISLTTDRLRTYVASRQKEGAANATINIELALLGRGFTLAVQARRLGRNRVPYLPKLAQDEGRVRQGFFTREQVESLCTHLPMAIADIVLFLFFSAWRVGEARTLEWRDYDRAGGVVRLRPEHSKNSVRECCQWTRASSPTLSSGGLRRAVSIVRSSFTRTGDVSATSAKRGRRRARRSGSPAGSSMTSGAVASGT